GRPAVRDGASSGGRHRDGCGRHRHGHPSGTTQPGDGTVVFNQGEGSGAGSIHRAGYTGEERRQPARGQRAGQRGYLHRVFADGLHRGDPQRRTPPSSILVVDDEIDTCRNLSDILTDLGYQVDTALDGFAALELAREKPYDIALLDLKMPGMDGLT